MVRKVRMEGERGGLMDVKVLLFDDGVTLDACLLLFM